MAMFIGNLTPLIIVMGACGLTADAGFAEPVSYTHLFQHQGDAPDGSSDL